jgi:hypothetical protein
MLLYLFITNRLAGRDTAAASDLIYLNRAEFFRRLQIAFLHASEREREMNVFIVEFLLLFSKMGHPVVLHAAADAKKGRVCRASTL